MPKVSRSRRRNSRSNRRRSRSNRRSKSRRVSSRNTLRRRSRSRRSRSLRGGFYRAKDAKELSNDMARRDRKVAEKKAAAAAAPKKQWCQDMIDKNITPPASAKCDELID